MIFYKCLGLTDNIKLTGLFLFILFLVEIKRKDMVHDNYKYLGLTADL